MTRSCKWLLLVAVAMPLMGQDPAKVAGSVINHLTGEPVPKVRVSLFSVSEDDSRKQYAAFTSEEGKFSWASVAPGHYIVQVRAPGFVMAPESASNTNLQLSSGGASTDLRFEIEPAGSIAGTVVDNHGDPVTGARVSFEDEGRNETTNDKGEFTFDRL